MKTTLNRNTLLEIHLPSTWWKGNGHRFPLLARLARKYQAITATSTPAEGVLSVAGLVVSCLKASLSPEHVDMLVFSNKNMDLKFES